jgi:hypothetical protein
VSVGYRASLLPTVSKKFLSERVSLSVGGSRLAVEVAWVERGRFFHCWRVGELPGCTLR